MHTNQHIHPLQQIQVSALYFSYLLRAMLNIQEVSVDQQNSYKIPTNYEKSYALQPENSIKFENKFFTQTENGKEYCLVEAALVNSMKDKAFVMNFQVVDNPQAKKVDVLELNMQEQEVGKRSTYKFIIRYELQTPPGTHVTDFGRVQFNWRSEKAEVDGGILAYSIKSTVEKKPMEFQVERVDNRILKKNEIVEVDLAFTNL